MKLRRLLPRWKARDPSAITPAAALKANGAQASPHRVAGWLMEADTMNEAEITLSGRYGFYEFIKDDGRRDVYFPIVEDQALELDGPEARHLTVENRLAEVCRAVRQQLKMRKKEFHKYVTDYRSTEQLEDQSYWDNRLYPAAAAAIVDAYKRSHVQQVAA